MPRWKIVGSLVVLAVFAEMANAVIDIAPVEHRVFELLVYLLSFGDVPSPVYNLGALSRNSFLIFRPLKLKIIGLSTCRSHFITFWPKMC